MPGHHPPGPGMGGNGNLGSVTKRFCLICSPGSAIFEPCLGRDMGGRSCGERNADFAGETRISLERGLEAGGLGGYSHHPMVVTTLALEVALCQSASFPIAQSGARGGGRRCRGVE